MMTRSDPAPATPRFERWLTIGLLAAMAFGIWGLVARTGWAEMLAPLTRLGAGSVLALLALSLCNYLLRGLRWHLFQRALGLPVSLGQSMGHFIAGLAMSVTPARLGELVRMRWLRRETGWSAERTAPLMLLDRAADLAAVAAMVGLGLWAAGGQIALAGPVIALAFVVAALATRPQPLMWLAALTFPRFPRAAARIRRAGRSLAALSGGFGVVAGLVLGLIGWAAEGYAFALTLAWLGAPLHPGMAMAIFGFATIAGGLTGAPGGLGGAEGAMVALLLAQDVPLVEAVAATAVIRLTTLWFAVVLGLGAYPFVERRSKA